MCLYVNTFFVDSFMVMHLTYGCSGSLSWEQLLRNARLRKAYVSLYASLLKSDMSRLVVDGHEEIKRMDRELDMEVILQWR
jgi:vacuolar protein sorting-associated protein 13A/C